MLAWASDLHLDHLPAGTLAPFLERVRAAAPDLLLLGGDVSNAGRLIEHLGALLEAAAPASVRLVLGNHDYYHGSLGEVNRRIAALTTLHPGRLIRLDGAVPETLGGDTWLVGSGGWGDLRAGGRARPVALNDEALIAELRAQEGWVGLSPLLKSLGDGAARDLAGSLERVPAGARRVLVLTHVPPFAGAAWHRGRPSEPAFQQRFCWAAGGEALLAFTATRPEVETVVLCGHTHGGGFLRVSTNLSVVTAPAEYGHPRLSCFAADAPAEEIARVAGAWATAGCPGN